MFSVAPLNTDTQPGLPKLPPVQFNTAPLATVSGPEPPLPSVAVPVNTLLPLKEIPLKVRVVMLPPWKPGPNTRGHPNNCKFGITLLASVIVVPLTCNAPAPVNVGVPPV